MKRLLVIRGGALGDFVLTLPALRLLREAWPEARLEILGYRHIISLAEKRYYAEAVRSIEYGPLASFFAAGAELPEELCAYFGSFDLIVSYLFDPDGVFETNLRRCGRMQIIVGPAKLSGDDHAARQLARPLAALGLESGSAGAELFMSAEDEAASAGILPRGGGNMIAIHPGSGSASKNWPLANWIALGKALFRTGACSEAFPSTSHRDVATGRAAVRVVVIGGEADAEQVGELRRAWADLFVSFVIGQPLPTVAAVLARCSLFLGHDSGISHVAAAVGTPALLLFGPTEPTIWAPANPQVRVLRAPSGAMADLALGEVAAAAYELMRIGIRT